MRELLLSGGLDLHYQHKKSKIESNMALMYLWLSMPIQIRLDQLIINKKF